MEQAETESAALDFVRTSNRLSEQQARLSDFAISELRSIFFPLLFSLQEPAYFYILIKLSLCSEELTETRDEAYRIRDMFKAERASRKEIASLYFQYFQTVVKKEFSISYDQSTMPKKIWE